MNLPSDMGAKNPQPISRILTITFNDGSIYVAKDVRNWGVEGDTLYFCTEENPNRVIYVLAHSMKLYEMETLR